MNLIEELMTKRFILRKSNSDLYYRLKDNSKELQKQMQEKLGYILIINQHLIKLEKIPGKAEPWMGIQEFVSVKEYQMFCYVLMFLEDKGVEEQFVLSSLTEYIQAQFKEHEIDWTNFTTRRQLIRVVKFCVANFIIENDDGDEDQFSQDFTAEVLYENTGVSRYFLRHFARDILEFKQPQDFEQSDWIDMDEKRGILRRQRMYRRLLLSPGVYRSNNVVDEDFAYLRNYRTQIASDFNSYFSCDLHLHRSSAYLSLADNCAMGKNFPSNNGLHDLILIVMQSLREIYRNSKIEMSTNECQYFERKEFDVLIAKVIEKSYLFMPKKYQEIETVDLASQISSEMERYGFIKSIEEDIEVNPICAKIGGNYTGGAENVYK